MEERPLFGKRVLVTRPRHQAGDLVRQLEDLGAAVWSLPVVAIGEPADWAPVDRALADLAGFGWVVFTSANGVHALMHRLRTLGRDLTRPGGLPRLAVIGPSTGDALRSYHLEPDLMPAEYNSEALAAALLERVRGQRVLLARADRGLDLLRERLGVVAEVEQVAVYAQTDEVQRDEEVLGRLRRGEIDYVTLTSSNIAQGFVRAVDEEVLGRVRAGAVGLVTISPRTSAAVRTLGLPVAGEARTYTTAGVVEALCELAERGRAGEP
jgi:uroporphyrinogen III methyltransferase/synthase